VPVLDALKSLLNPVVLFSVLMLLGVLVLLGAAILGRDSGVLERMSEVRYARGVITYLFAVVTIGTAVVLVVSVLTQTGAAGQNFTEAKDILGLLLGIFGTIVGFYFGQENTKVQTDATKLTASINAIGAEALAGQPIMTASFAHGGKPPYTYSLRFGEEDQGAGTFEKNGWLLKEVLAPSTPADQPKQLALTVTDVSGSTARAVSTILVKSR
jgi:hypothetical protein